MAATQLSCTRRMSGNGRARLISKRTFGSSCSQNCIIPLAIFASAIVCFVLVSAASDATLKQRDRGHNALYLKLFSIADQPVSDWGN